MGAPEGRRPCVQGKGLAEGLSLKELLHKHGARPKKGLGQHFLVSPSAVRDIVACADGYAGVLEIGPGPGILTAPLCLGRTVTAVEVDEAILPVLAETAPSARVVVSDALEADLAALLAELPEPRCVVSNMPYNITGPLLARITEVKGLFGRAVLMMQREVASKILALPGQSERGALSVAMQAQFGVRKVCQVPPGAFLPPPKVASTVLCFEPKQVDDDTVASVLALVSTGFRQPRKTLANNLTARLGREEADRRIASAGLRADVRPHQVTWEQWKALAA